MNNFFKIIELKLSIAGVLFIAVTSADIAIILKLIGAFVYIGYVFRKWYLMEKHNKKSDDQ